MKKNKNTCRKEIKSVGENNMGMCGYWTQHFYKDDFDAEYEKCYDWCNKIARAITGKDCYNCKYFDNMYEEKNAKKN